MPSLSRIDQIYRSILFSKYFIKGWGSPSSLKRLLKFRKTVSNREKCFRLVPEIYPVEITKETTTSYARILEGRFVSPFDLYLPELLPPEVKMCHFQILLPREWSQPGYKPMCIHMAGTGDHYFWRRRTLLAKPLLKEAGIGSIILENPFYGLRKPVYQVRSVLHNVLDIFIMGGCLILEALVLLHWCKRKGYGPLGLTGISMGGHMASLAATNWPEPVALIPCLSWSTASAVFTEGVLSRAIDWDMLEAQFKDNEEYRNEIQEIVHNIQDDAFLAGRELVKNFPESMVNLDVKDRKMFLDSGALSYTATCDSSDDEQKSKTDKSDTKGIADRFSLLNKFNDFIFSSEKHGQVNWPKHEAIHFMKGIMDECTHIKHFSTPVDPSLIITVCAEADGYVPREGVTDIRDIWPGAEVRYVDCGHISAFLLYQKMFRQAIRDAFERHNQKYGSSKNE